MARNISDTLGNIYNGCRRRGYCYVYSADANAEINTRKFMIIPIDKEEFEIPVFAMNTFIESVRSAETDNSICAYLQDKHARCNYVSLNSVLCCVLEESFVNSGLVKIRINKLSKTYYGTYGALFDENFKPMIMCSWIIKRRTNSDGDFVYSFIKPVLRISPDCYGQIDSLKRFITGKLITESLARQVHSVGVNLGRELCDDDLRAYYDIRIEIDKCPFTIKSIDKPSILTTNERLVSIAQQYIDEIIQ